MGVKLREKKMADGKISYYLDIYHSKKRWYEFLNIHINKTRPNEDDKEKKRLAQEIKIKRENELIVQDNGLVDKSKRKADFVEWFDNYIVTSTIFYNISTPTKKFKQDFLTQFCIDSFFDLSPVRRLIFEEKNSPCAIVFYHLSDGENHLTNVIQHSSIKSNSFLKYYKTIVIEKFDQKKIQQKHFIDNDWMFKVALYGNTLDFLLVKKLELNKTKISDLIDDVTIFSGAGIKSNKGDNPSDFLIGLPLIENGEIQDFYTPLPKNRKKLTSTDVYYESGRRKELFVGNKILIKEQARNESDLVISYSDKTCVYKNGVWGISSRDEESIKLMYSYLITELYTYYIYITACSWGVATRPQIRLEEEYLSFPFIVSDKKTNSELIRLVNKFLTPYEEFFKKFNLGAPLKSASTLNTINEVIEDLYDINGYEKDLINYVLTVSRYQFQESKQQKIIRKVHNDKTVLENYAQVFLNEFENIYENEHIQVNIFSLNHFIAMSFVFKKEKPVEIINIIQGNNNNDENEVFSIIAKSVSVSQIAKDLYIQKDIKGFEENSFYIIKPNEFKCWHKAMAWYDVAEIKEAIQSSELDRQTKQTQNSND